jgi:hypothetical protein
LTGTKRRVIAAKEAAETATLQLIFVAEKLRTEPGDYDTVESRKQLFRAARVYASAIDRLTRVRTRR